MSDTSAKLARNLYFDWRPGMRSTAGRRHSWHLDDSSEPDLRDDATAGVLWGMLCEASWSECVLSRVGGGFTVHVDGHDFRESHAGEAIGKALLALWPKD